MRYYVEDSLSNFEFWSGAKRGADLLTTEQFDTVESMMEDAEPGDGWSDTAINDFFWFEFDTIAQWLGYADEEHLEADVSEKEVEEAQEWAENVSTDYNALYAIANLDLEEYTHTDEDGEDYEDYEQATEDFMKWWDSMDDIEQVEEYRKYKD